MPPPPTPLTHAQVKDFLDNYFTPSTKARWLKEAMDPYYYARAVKNVDTPREACPPGCSCNLCRHVTRLFVGSATLGQVTEWQAALEAAVAAGKAKAEKIAERNKAKRKAQKARKKATAMATSNSEGVNSEGEGEDEATEQAGDHTVDSSALATLLAGVKTTIDSTTKSKTKDHAAGQDPTQSGTKRKPAPTAVERLALAALALRPNLLCPVCSPHTSFLCCFEHSATYDPVRDRRCHCCAH